MNEEVTSTKAPVEGSETLVVSGANCLNVLEDVCKVAVDYEGPDKWLIFDEFLLKNPQIASTGLRRFEEDAGAVDCEVRTCSLALRAMAAFEECDGSGGDHSRVVVFGYIFVYHVSKFCRKLLEPERLWWLGR